MGPYIASIDPGTVLSRCLQTCLPLPAAVVLRPVPLPGIINSVKRLAVIPDEADSRSTKPQ